MAGKAKFDQEAAFKSIIGIGEESPAEPTAPKQTESRETEVIISAQEKKEARSKRVNLLVKPSVHERAIKRCESMGISLNECVNQFLEKWVDE